MRRPVSENGCIHRAQPLPEDGKVVPLINQAAAPRPKRGPGVRILRQRGYRPCERPRLGRRKPRRRFIQNLPVGRMIRCDDGTRNLQIIEQFQRRVEPLDARRKQDVGRTPAASNRARPAAISASLPPMMMKRSPGAARTASGIAENSSSIP